MEKFLGGLAMNGAGRDASTARDRPSDDPASLSMTEGNKSRFLTGLGARFGMTKVSLKF